MNHHISRTARLLLRTGLDQRGCVLLLGPRQVGKTTLARDFAGEIGQESVYLDLEQDNQFHEPENIRHFAENHVNKLIILDEAQCAPKIFPALRQLLDGRDGVATGDTKWLLLGSATAELEALANGHLGGRFATIDLAPLQLTEIETDRLEMTGTTSASMSSGVIAEQSIKGQVSPYDTLRELWLRGGFPKSFLARDEQTSLDWRADYLRSVLGPQSTVESSFSRQHLLEVVWQRLSINHGGSCDLVKTSSQLGCKQAELQGFLRALVQSQLVRELQPWFPNEGKRLQKQARLYIRDSGLLHAQWRFNTIDQLLAHSINGKSWEGFVLETLVNAAPRFTKPYFYRNDRDQEVDIILEFSPERRWAIEVKLNARVRAGSGFHAASDDIRAEQRFIVHSGQESILAEGEQGVDQLCLSDAALRVSAQ